MWAPMGRPWGEPVHLRRLSRGPETPVLVAGWRDAQDVAPAPVVYVEHGAGQTYEGDPRGFAFPSYSGGTGLERAVLFLSPSETVAGRWRERYPTTPAVAVGCPRIDRWTNVSDGSRQWTPPGLARDRTTGSRPTVAVSFHWECALVPETRSAWRYYDQTLEALAADGRWTLLGHGHPRIYGVLRRRWAQLEISRTPDAGEVFAHADLLVADNTSLLPEFAATGRPVVCLNAPWYRRGVHHGGRFWDNVPGLQVDRPEDLINAVAHALTDPPILQRLRRESVARWYAYTDGHAAERAASAIMELIT